MKELIDLDGLAIALPEMLPRGKKSNFEPRCRRLADLCSALQLTIHLGRPAAEVIEACIQLDLAVRQMAQLVARSSLPRGAQLACQRLKDLSARLRADITSSLVAQGDRRLIGPSG